MNQLATETPRADGNGAAGAEARKAYISAPKSADTRYLRSLLAGKGVETFSPDQLDLPGQNLAQILKEAMQQADLVIGVVDPTPDSSFVFYELGLAQGLSKATMVLLVGDASASPWLASGIPYFRFDPAKPTGLEFGISQILKAARHGTIKPVAAARRTHPIGDDADEFLAALRRAGDTITEVELTKILEEAIRASGVFIVAGARVQEKIVDLAIWSDDLAPWVGNPFPIEVRVRLGSRKDLATALHALERALTSGTSPWALLIHHLSPPHVEWLIDSPNVLTLSAEQFLEELRTKSFGDLIRGMRNQRVHGGP